MAAQRLMSALGRTRRRALLAPAVVALIVLGALQLTSLGSGAAPSGGTWVAATTEPSFGSDGYIAGVACTSTTVCSAVGQYNFSQSLTAYSTDGGTTWASHFMSGGTGTGDALAAVSCPTAATCIAVGHTNISGGLNFDPLIAASANGGSTYAALPLPTLPVGTSGNPAGNMEMTGISCPSSLVCVAVGEYSTGGQFGPLIYNTTDGGSTWNLATTLPPNIFFSIAHPQAISCASSTVCVITGWVATSVSGSPYTLAMRTTDGGASWTLITSMPPNTFGDQLIGISCPDATTCVAVGTHNGSSGIEIYSTDGGITWASATSVASPATVLSFQGVACSSATLCLASGFGSTAPTKEIADSSDDGGVTWQAATSVATPDLTTENKLQGVGCFALHCVVGGQTGGTLLSGTSLMEHSDLTTYPGAPTGVSASAGAAGTGTATVSWAGPAFSGGLSVIGYTVTAIPGGATAAVTGTTASFSALSPGTTYTFTVTATNGVGVGAASVPSIGVTPAAAVVAPTTTTAATQNSTPVVTPLPAPIVTTTTTTLPAPKSAVKTAAFIVANNVVPVALACTVRTCSGTVELTRTQLVTVKVGTRTTTKKVTVILAKQSYKIAAKKTATVGVSLVTAQKNYFATAKKKGVTATLVVTVSGGKSTSKTITVT